MTEVWDDRALKPLLQVLKPVFKKWIDLTKKYVREYHKHNPNEWDAPYFYNERATISVLAAAAWQSGCLALEEYIATGEKREERKANRKGKGHPRIDFWVGKKRQEFTFEAKQDYYKLNSKMDVERKCKALMGERSKKGAIQDALRNDVGKDKNRLAIGFIVPYWGIKRGQKVKGKWSDGKWYKGKITKINPQGKKAYVVFDDRDEAWLPFSKVKPRPFTEFWDKLDNFEKEVLKIKNVKVKGNKYRVSKIGLLYRTAPKNVPNYYDGWSEKDSGSWLYYPGVIALICRVPK